jgi:uncharacterized protein YcfL
MKKISLLLLGLLFMMASCSNRSKVKVVNYDVAVITSEVQEHTHNLKLAHLDNDIYVEVPNDYDKDTISIEYTGKVIYYHTVNGDKVSNKGYELK